LEVFRCKPKANPVLDGIGLLRVSVAVIFSTPVDADADADTTKVF
jgi:hypothetical protein